MLYIINYAIYNFKELKSNKKYMRRQTLFRIIGILVIFVAFVLSSVFVLGRTKERFSGFPKIFNNEEENKEKRDLGETIDAGYDGIIPSFKIDSDYNSARLWLEENISEYAQGEPVLGGKWRVVNVFFFL